MNYSRVGAYQDLKKNVRKGLLKHKPKIDWLNVILFIVLIIVIIIFVFGGK